MLELRRPRVAIVHDYLMQMGGAEKVVEVLHDMYPDAPVYTSAYDARAMPDRLRSWDIRTTFLQRMPAKRRIQRLAMLLYPLAFESLDLTGYDVVISSCSTFAKGVMTPPGTAHVCYCYTPMRYAWIAGTVRQERPGALARALGAPALHYLRMWDLAAAARVDRLVAISSCVEDRIAKFYRRSSEIVHPPVDVEGFAISDTVDSYYIIASRCIPYKRLDLAIDAFTRLNRPLKVVGTGRGMKALRARAGACVEFLGHVSDRELLSLMARARAYVMPGEEDFGLAPVEANACGRPVIAFGAGGALDTQVDGLTGVLFREQTVEALCEAVYRLDGMDIRPRVIREHARRFSVESFRKAMSAIVEEEHGRLDSRSLRTVAASGALSGVMAG